MKDAWRDLEDALIAELAPAVFPNGPFRRVGSYSEQAQRILSDGAAGHVPACLISVEQADYQPAVLGRDYWTETVRVVALIAWNHPHSETVTRRGNTASDGLQQLVHRTIAALTDRAYDDWSAMTPQSVRTRRHTRALTLAAIEFEAKRHMALDDLRGITWGDLVTIAGTINPGETDETGFTLTDLDQ